jgi:hypothetical protein
MAGLSTLARATSAILALCVGVFSGTASANLLTNGDFEAGTLAGWSNVGPDLSPGCGGQHQAVAYASAIGAFCSSAPLVPPYAGGTFAAYSRTGDGTDIGFGQTVAVIAGVPIFFSLDFAVREVQIAGEGRANQMVKLFLNGDMVASQSFGAPTTNFGHFEGLYTPGGSSLDFVMVSNRPLSFGTGFGQVFFDNAVIEQSVPMPEPSSALLLGAGFAGLFGWRRRRFAKKSFPSRLAVG